MRGINTSTKERAAGTLTTTTPKILSIMRSTPPRAENSGVLPNKTVGDIKKESEAQYKVEIGLSKGENSLTNPPKKCTLCTRKVIQVHKEWTQEVRASVKQ